MNTQGYIFDIKRFAIHDGPGIRTTVFFKGCPLSCWWCHNPESQLMLPQVSVGGVTSRTVGKKTTVVEVLKEIEKETIFFDESGGGVTFSGGEPLMQPVFLEALLDSCAELDIHTAVDTCGYAEEKVFRRIAEKADLFLYDLKIIDDDDHLRYTGVSNRLIIRNLQTLSRIGKTVYIRFPVIPGITATEKNLLAMAHFIGSLDSVTEVGLLPYHIAGSHKYKKIGIPDKMIGVPVPLEDELEHIAEVLGTSGLRINVGG